MSILDEIVERIQIDGSRMSVRPSNAEGTPLELEISVDSTSARSAIAAYLYAHYYAYDPALCDAGALDYLTMLGQRVSDRAFLQALRAANPGGGFFQSGWRVIERGDSNQLRVEKDGVTLQVDARLHLRGERQETAVGELADIRFPKDSAMGAPGFYMAFADLGPAIKLPIVRVYLNLDYHCAVEVTHDILHRLLMLNIPYTYKVVADPARYQRRDTAVLYVSREYLNCSLAEVLHVRKICPAAFRVSVPSFTRRICDGIAAADSPPAEFGVEVSFGEHRTRIIADAICHAVTHNLTFGSTDLRATIEEHLRLAGLDIRRLYLSKASEDYIFHLDERARTDAGT